MLMIRPTRRARMAGRTALSIASGPMTLVSNWARTSSSERLFHRPDQAVAGVVDQDVDLAATAFGLEARPRFTAASSVTSSTRARPPSSSKASASAVLRTVPNTRSPRARAARAISRPEPAGHAGDQPGLGHSTLSFSLVMPAYASGSVGDQGDASAAFKSVRDPLLRFVAG